MENTITETITTNTGKVFTCKFFGITSDARDVQIILSETDIATLFSVFIDQNETRKLIYMQGQEGETEIYNYVVMNLVVPMGEDIRVSMRRPYVGELPEYVPYGGLEGEE